MFVYAKLWALLNQKGLKKTDLLNCISSATLAKLSKNEKVNMDTIANICEYLDCQPGDIFEYIPKKKLEEMKSKMSEMEDMLKVVITNSGLTKDEFVKEFQEYFTNLTNETFKDEQ